MKNRLTRPLYIGIDDTDNLESRGTGFRARQLVEQLEQHRLAQGAGVTRHQLLFDERVPYTSHNSAACLAVSSRHDVLILMDFCREFLLGIAATGSDVGLCIAEEDQARQAADFGRLAQTDLLTRQAATDLAGRLRVPLQGLTGDHQGIIGALAAVGLHMSGNDGRYIWGRGLREHAGETLSLSALRKRTSIDRVALAGGESLVDERALIDFGPWPRPVRIDWQSVLLVEKTSGSRYKVLDKEIIKSNFP